MRNFPRAGDKGIPRLTTPAGSVPGAHQPVGQLGGNTGKHAQDHDLQHHAEHIGNGDPHDFRQRHVGRDGVDDAKVQSDRRMDQADLHVDGEDHAEPHRVEAGALDDGLKDRGGHQDDRRRRNEKAADQQEDVDHPHQYPAVDVHVGDPLREQEPGQRISERKHECGRGYVADAVRARFWFVVRGHGKWWLPLVQISCKPVKQLANQFITGIGQSFHRAFGIRARCLFLNGEALLCN